MTAVGAGTTSVDVLTGEITYTHNGSAGTADSFEYTVEDAGGNLSNDGLVSITIYDDLDPIAVADSGTLDTGGVVVIDVLANDTDDIGLDASSVRIVQAPANGTATVNPATGVVTYTSSGLLSSDEFTYTVLDNVGQESDEATVSVAILPVGLVAHYESDALVEEADGSVSAWIQADTDPSASSTSASDS